jgi:hypothetical protein
MLWVPLLAALATAPVGAEPLYGGAAGSTNGGGYILNGGSSTPFSANKGNCGNNACVSTAIRAGPGILGASYVQAGSGNFISAGNGGAGAWAQGDVMVVRQAPGGPAFIDTVMHLHLDGATLVEVVGDQAKASGGVGVSVTGPTLGAAAYMKEYQGRNVDVPQNQYVGITRISGNELAVPLRITLGQPYTLRLTLEAFGTATGFGSASVQSLWLDTLSLPLLGPVFDLPAGYVAQSADWLINDNQWCPSGCPPVPEPASWAALLLGLLVLTCTTRQACGARTKGSAKATSRALGPARRNDSAGSKPLFTETCTRCVRVAEPVDPMQATAVRTS